MSEVEAEIKRGMVEEQGGVMLEHGRGAVQLILCELVVRIPLMVTYL